MYRYFINPFKNIKIGKNNIISKSAIIHNDVIIGDNNKIYDNVIIYPKTEIGNNNIIFNNNIIGEYPVQSSDKYRDYCFDNIKGIVIGDNNFFHVRNILFSGINDKTLIRDNNQILAECCIHHDVIINNNITLYPRSMLAGYVKCLDNSNMGGYSFIQQRTVIGQYTMVGGSQIVTKNVFPYFVFINNKPTRLNHIKLSDDIIKYEKQIKAIAKYYYDINKKSELKIMLYMFYQFL
jgi:acyl-[acyl carrier protein]--UDP-N-acetylglucosamine O-acyltransferase